MCNQCALITIGWHRVWAEGRLGKLGTVELILACTISAHFSSALIRNDLAVHRTGGGMLLRLRSVMMSLLAEWKPSGRNVAQASHRSLMMSLPAEWKAEYYAGFIICHRPMYSMTTCVKYTSCSMVHRGMLQHAFHQMRLWLKQIIRWTITHGFLNIFETHWLRAAKAR